MLFSNRFRVGVTICIIISLCTVLCIPTNAKECFHWYCKRTQDHTQPTLDNNMQWIEQVNGIYLDKRYKSSDDDKVLYLTFDAGYENGNIEKTLDILEEHKVKGAFFVLGNLIERNPDLVKRMENQGHLVCNHTYTHKDITTLSEDGIKDELEKLENAYKELTQKQISKYFRPPEGTFDHESLKAVAKLGYKTVFWSFAYADWDNNKQMNAQAAKKKIMDNLHNGEILLLHPTSATNVEILSQIISELKAMGYRFGSLDELEFGI